MSFPPLFTSPLKDSGCDVTDYRTILPEFGTLGEFKKLEPRVHERTMSLIIDLPLNHTSDRHTGFQQSREHRDGPNGPTSSCSAFRAARQPIPPLGDEIGLVDNIRLPDCDSSRTPMQWTPDRNAGFSAAIPESCFCRSRSPWCTTTRRRTWNRTWRSPVRCRTASATSSMFGRTIRRSGSGPCRS